MVSRAILISLVVVVTALAVSGGVAIALYEARQHQQTKVGVVATFYPEYDFAQNIGGDRISLSLLVPMTVDVHEFEPSPSSIQTVASAKVLIFNGAGLEPWVPQIVSAADNPNLVLVNASFDISLLLVPPEFQGNGRSVDPHTWLDPVLAKQQVRNILDGLVKADPVDKDYFTSNAQVYQAKLDFLNSQIVNATADVKIRYFVTFHTAFGYFAKRYNLTQIPVFGPFEEEPSPSDIQNVVNAIHQYGLCYVGYESLENPAISQSIASQTNATLVQMNPIEGLSSADQAAGKTYLILMQENVNNIVLALDHVGCS
jgi:zinc transport system substrate-binding protein